jgi:hypothetical protein
MPAVVSGSMLLNGRKERLSGKNRLTTTSALQVRYTIVQAWRIGMWITGHRPTNKNQG